jgi:hypothetical protein
VIVGRDVLLGRAEALLTRAVNSGQPGSSVLVITGARGLGKTVLLGLVADLARERGMLAARASLDRVSDNSQLLAAAVGHELATLTGDGLRKGWGQIRERLANLSVEVNAGVIKVASDPAAAPTPPASARRALTDLVVAGAQLATRHQRTGLVVLVDEMQEARTRDLVVLANTIQDSMQAADTPIVFVAAGLPHTPDVLLDAASFAERFEFRALGRVSADESERALVEPAMRLGVRWAPDAVAVVLAAASGSPYLIQRFGDEAWAAAAPAAGGTIGVARARDAVAGVQDNLAQGMFRGRWATSTPTEQALLVAMAHVMDDEGVAGSRDITEVSGRSSAEWSRARRSLIDKGLVESAGYGKLRFTMPGFGEYVLQANEVSRRGRGRPQIPSPPGRLGSGAGD